MLLERERGRTIEITRFGDAWARASRAVLRELGSGPAAPRVEMMIGRRRKKRMFSIPVFVMVSCFDDLEGVVRLFEVGWKAARIMWRYGGKF